MPTKSQQRRNRLQKNRASNLGSLQPEPHTAQESSQPASQNASQTTSQPESHTAQESSQNETKKENPEEFGIPRATVVRKANEIWKVLKNYAISNPEFKSLKEQDRMELFRTKFGYSMFMDEFPVVARYMVCHGQYSPKAFDRMLLKIEKTVHPPPDKRENGYMEDQWVRRQADYVQYLWESYQKRHQNTAERQWIWKMTYDNLKKEFDDFRNMHKEIEERVKVEKKTLAGQNARELLDRLASGEQKLNPDEETALLDQLKEVLEKKNNPDLESPEKDLQEYDFTKQKDPKILMIETVDVERMKDIDDKYKPIEFRGMEPILETSEEPIPNQ